MLLPTFIMLLLGFSLGSFLNVVIYRLPKGIPLVGVNSFCHGCLRELSWYEIIPVASLLALGGKCRSCSSKISWQYPAVELTATLIMIGTFLIYGFSEKFLMNSTFMLLAFPIAIIDWQHLVIPNKIIIVGLALGLLLNAAFYRADLLMHLASSLVALCSVLGVRIFGNWLFKKDTMGMGDVKFSALVGLFLGFQGFLVAFWFAAVTGAIYGIGMIIRQRRISPSRVVAPSGDRSPINHSPINHLPIPFGSFLALSSSIVLVFQENINSLLDSWLVWNP